MNIYPYYTTTYTKSTLTARKLHGLIETHSLTITKNEEFAPQEEHPFFLMAKIFGQKNDNKN